MKAKYKPGPGWIGIEINGPVYEKGAIRIHVSGSLVTSLITNKTIYVEPNARIYIKINGGNRKRGLMVYASHVRFMI